MGASGRDAELLQFIEDATKNADEMQRRVLAEILSQNAHTEYLQRYGLAGCTDRETFKKKVPLVTYDDIKPEIQRIANGDRSPILSSHPVSEFLTSSGTSAGERKLMPTIQQELDRRQHLYDLLIPVMNKMSPHSAVLIGVPIAKQKGLEKKRQTGACQEHIFGIAKQKQYSPICETTKQTDHAPVSETNS